MTTPQTYRIYLPASRKTLDYGGSGNAATNALAAFRRAGFNPELANPGEEIKVSCLLTKEVQTGTVETKGNK